MQRKTIGWFVLALAIVAAPLVSAGRETFDLNEQKARAFCSQTADLSKAACWADVAEEFYRGRAICLNILDLEERRDCIAERNGARNEMREECDAIHEARLDVCDLLGEGRYHPDFDPANFTEPDMIGTQNPYFSLAPGHTIVLHSGDGEEVTVVTVTDRVVDIAGVSCRVVVDAVLAVDSGVEKGAGVEYEAVELTDDWYAYHTATGDVWYCGEHVLNFEDGVVVDLEGSFAAGVEGAKPGILIPFEPFVGQAYRQEWALDEAEDLAEVVSLAASPGGDEDEGEDEDDKGGSALECDDDCLKTREGTPLEPGHEEFKYYKHGIGFVAAEGIEDGEFEGLTEIVTCAGDSLDILEDPACAIENLESLLDALCTVAPDTFCPDGD